jgi:hypothetical protein
LASIATSLEASGIGICDAQAVSNSDIAARERILSIAYALCFIIKVVRLHLQQAGCQYRFVRRLYAGCQ